LIPICVSLGLTADYALAAESDAPVICYGGSWMKLEKYLDGDTLSSSMADASGKALIAEGIFERGLQFVDFVKELARLNEQLNIAEKSMGYATAFSYVTLRLENESRKAGK
tara:strand:+ start:101 stop:433 length:333 start_codon:yes stop_codon:yes gene_type:complete